MLATLGLFLCPAHANETSEGLDVVITGAHAHVRRVTDIDHVEHLIRSFHESVCDVGPEKGRGRCRRIVRRRRASRRARAIAEMIVDAAYRHPVSYENIDWPSLVTIVVQHESSFREGYLPGADGELGLMQVHGEAAKGCDLTTSEGQLDCGTKWLASRLDKCGGDVLCALVLYQTGEYKTSDKRPKRRYRKYLIARRD